MKKTDSGYRTEKITMRILSLFDGMACGMLALLRSGIEVECYDAYEIDKYAIQTATHNFPNIKEHGDVFKADFTEYLGTINIMMGGGSPCTYWSIAQAADRRETTASGIGWELFSQYIRALKEAKPDYFIYENNKSMSKTIYKSISDAFGFEPIMINSALVSAQNRQRYYWVGKRNKDGTYSKIEVKQPGDRGIILKNVLNGVEYFKKNQGQMRMEPVNTTIDGKAQCLRATCYKDGISNIAGNTIDRKTGVAEPVGLAQRGRYGGSGVEQHYEVREDGKSNCLTTVQKDTLVGEPVSSSVQVGALPRPNGKLSKSQGFRIHDINAKSVTLKDNAGGAGGKTGLYAIPAFKELTEKEMDYMVRGHADRRWNALVKPGEKDKSPTITANIHKGVPYNVRAIPAEWDGDEPTQAVSTSDGKTHKVYKVENGMIRCKDKPYPIKLADGYYIIRKLTVSECKRLQTVPEWYEFPVSDTQAYKMLGNGWTVEVIAHLINCIVKGRGEMI